MSELIEVVVRGRAGSGKSAITLEIAKVLRSHGLICDVELNDPQLEETITEEIQSRRLRTLAASNRIVVIKEVQAPRAWSTAQLDWIDRFANSK